MGILEEMRDLLISIDSKMPSNGPIPPDKKWPNEPKGFVTLTDWDMTASPNGLYSDEPIPGAPDGWKINYNTPPGTIFGPNMGPEFNGTPAGWLVSSDEQNAPCSPTKCYDFVYPKGMRLGTAPATVYTAETWYHEELYIAYWSRISDPFDYSTNGQKMVFVFNGNSNGQIFTHINPADKTVCVMPEYPDPPPIGPAYHTRTPNCKPEDLRLFTPGVWHLLEWHMKMPKTNDPANCILKWWMDGVLQGDYNDVWNSESFSELKISPTFGGNGNVYKTEEDHWIVDHFYVSVPKQ